MQNIKTFSQHIVLRNGESVVIRAIRPDDKRRLLDGFHRLTGKSVYFRFLCGKRNLTKDELKYFTEVDFDHHVALVVTKEEKRQEEIIGVGRYVQDEEERPERVAEIAFAVDDAYHDVGIGTLLFEYLVTIARDKGISRLTADVLLENKHMLKLFNHSGFQLNSKVEKGVVHIEFDIKAQQSNRYYIK
jgi:GNAT superfamily N-acetyltransferase